MNLSNEFIIGLATCITTVICTIIPCVYSALSNKNIDIHRNRFENVLYPIMCILENLRFSYETPETATEAITKIKSILETDRLLAGEKLQQYIYDFEKAETEKGKRKAFSYMCEYIIKQFNKTARILKLPIISYNIRMKRFWWNRYSFKFLSKFLLLTLIEFAAAFFVFLIFVGVVSCILQWLLQTTLR